MTGPGSSETRSHSSSGEQPGVKPVVAVSGRTTSSAPVASTHRVSQSTHFSMLALTTSGLRGPMTGAVWTAAAVKARMSTPPGSDAHGHAGESDRGARQRPIEEVPALEWRAANRRRSGSPENKEARRILFGEGDVALIGALDRGDSRGDRHLVDIGSHLAQLLTPRDRAGQDGRIVERGPDLVDGGVEYGGAGDLHQLP